MSETGESTLVPLPWTERKIRVRVATRDDDLDAVHEGDPEWTGQQAMWEMDAVAPPDIPRLNVIAERRGVPIGAGRLIGAPGNLGGTGIAYAFVLREHRGHGAGGAMLRVLAGQAAEYGLPGISCSRVAAEDDATVAALARIGCREQGRHQESELDLTSLDGTRVEAMVDRAKWAGVRLAPLPEGASDADWDLFYALYLATDRDSPDHQGASRARPLPMLRRWITDPWMVLLAWAGDRPVGLTSVTPHRDEGAINTMLTGVVPEARGRGIATALKAEHARRLAERGYTRVVTQNMEQNAPILAANAKLGFVARRTYLNVVLPAVPA